MPLDYFLYYHAIVASINRMGILNNCITRDIARVFNTVVFKFNNYYNSPSFFIKNEDVMQRKIHPTLLRDQKNAQICSLFKFKR